MPAVDSLWAGARISAFERAATSSASATRCRHGRKRRTWPYPRPSSPWSCSPSTSSAWWDIPCRCQPAAGAVPKWVDARALFRALSPKRLETIRTLPPALGPHRRERSGFGRNSKHTDFWALREHFLRTAARRDPRHHRRERFRQEHTPADRRRSPPADLRDASPSKAVWRRCSNWEQVLIPSSPVAKTSTSTARSWGAVPGRHQPRLREDRSLRRDRSLH